MDAEENAGYYDRKTSIKYAYFHLISSIVIIGSMVLFFSNVSFMDEILVFSCMVLVLSMFAYNGIYNWYIVVVKKELLEIPKMDTDPNLGGMPDFDH